MATRIAILLTALLLAWGLGAQTTSDSKDLQIAKQILQLRARQLDSIVTVITSANTDRMSPTAKAVYDYVQANIGGGGGGGGGHVLANQGVPLAQRDTADFRDDGDIDFTLTNSTPKTSITAALKVNTVDSTKIKAAGIAASDLGQMGATTGQLLRWSGTAWVANGTNLYDVVTASGTIATKNNQVWVNTLSAAISLNLPACNAANDGLKFEIIKAGSDTFKVDIEPAGSETFNDAATTKSLYSRATGLSCTCRWNGSSGSWFFLNM